jgi:hypothetical protein
MRMCVILLVTTLAQTPRRRRTALDVDLLIEFLSAGLHAVLDRDTGAETA